MKDLLKRIGGVGILPVIKIEEIENAAPMAKALIDGGIPIAEITFRAAGAEKAIKAVRDAYPDMLVGAGTVTNMEQVKAAQAAGAEFLVSPGFNPRVVAYCNEIGMPIVPGCTTPSEIEQAMELGLETVKFFPAEQSGGLEKIKALSGPFGNISFIPTGGIDLKNITDYLAFDKIIACGGSFMVKEEMIKNQEWDKITSLSRQAVDTVLGFEMGHVGINAAGIGEAEAVASLFGALLHMPLRDAGSSVFVGNAVEVMKEPWLGKSGHIGIRTNSVFRAKSHLESRGIRFREDTIKYNERGVMLSVYLEQEIGGFAVHLAKK